MQTELQNLIQKPWGCYFVRSDGVESIFYGDASEALEALDDDCVEWEDELDS